MKQRKYTGMDVYRLSTTLETLLKICEKKGLCVYNIQCAKSFVHFEVRVKDRALVQRELPEAKYMHTRGLVGILVRTICNKGRLLLYCICVALWLLLSNTVLSIEVVGNSDSLDQNIKDTLRGCLYTIKDVKEVKKTLLDTYKGKLSWLEVYDKGSVLYIQYKKKEEVSAPAHENKALIATKDGVIAYFKCDAGFKTKSVNDVVKKGDILVDTSMRDSFLQDVDVDVRGRVFAYTWQRVEVEVKQSKWPRALSYFSLLLEARNQVSIELVKEEKVIKENVLQFSQNQGKIKLVILYTLLEDITS